MISRFSFFFIFALISDAAGIDCPNGFYAMNGQKCVKLFRNNLKHLEAEIDCSYFGGTLVTIKNAVDNRAITNLAASAGVQNVWIGMFCFATGNTTTCYHDDDSGIVSYKNFAAGNPQLQGHQGCVYLSTNSKTSGQWLSAPCGVIGMSFVCEAPPTVADPTCVHNFNGYCYTGSNEMGLRWNTSGYTSAQASCQAIGANLVSIHSQSELNFVKAIYKSYKDVRTIFLGAQASSSSGAFKWVDGSDWDYDYTDPISKTKGDCLVMDLLYTPNTGLWHRVNSQDSWNGNNYFMCKRKISSVKSNWLEPQKVKPQKARHQLLDTSNCNSTLYMAPGVITSFGYPNSPPVTNCTWNIAVLGPYRVGLYFSNFSVSNAVFIYDEFGNIINSPVLDWAPFSVLGETNFVKITHDSSLDAVQDFHGFRAVVLPY